jgi:uncharacterized protein YjbJ (UPF0337 family)
MNEDTFQGKWKQFRGQVQQKWGDLTDDDLDRVKGEQKEFEGLLQERYGYTKERAQREVDEFFNSHKATH